MSKEIQNYIQSKLINTDSCYLGGEFKTVKAAVLSSLKPQFATYGNQLFFGGKILVTWTKE